MNTLNLFKIMFFTVLFLTNIRLFIIIQSMIDTEIKGESHPLNLKFILAWFSNDYPERILLSGQEAFIKSKCPMTNCFVTDRKDYFGKDGITQFDAILLNGNKSHVKPSELPKKRSPHQIYIFSSMESADYIPMCNPVFNGFFNWTMTHKLDSDIVFSYLIILNSTGHEVGPRVNMTWIDHMSTVNETFRDSLKTKSKAVAWFVSHCRTRGRREVYALTLKDELSKHNLVLDMYGECSDKICPHANRSMCDDMLKKDYYFYLSFENSMQEDYATEKLLTAVLNNVIPIVYGGANYPRFLPPGSYLDARQHTPGQLASVIAHLIKNPDEYSDFFRWRNHYTYSSTDESVASSNNICRLCTALNNETKVKTPQVYQNFRSWWNPNFRQRCEEEISNL